MKEILRKYLKGIIMEEIIVPAQKKYLSSVIEFIENQLDKFEYSTKALLLFELSVEEAFVNIANYAYESWSEDSKSTTEVSKSDDYPNKSDGEKIIIKSNVDENPLQITVQLIDSGRPFNPLKVSDPDISLSIDDREEGGLGIFLIKKNVDELQYQYQDGKNILTIGKIMI